MASPSTSSTPGFPVFGKDAPTKSATTTTVDTPLSKSGFRSGCPPGVVKLWQAIRQEQQKRDVWRGISLGRPGSGGNDADSDADADDIEPESENGTDKENLLYSSSGDMDIDMNLHPPTSSDAATIKHGDTHAPQNLRVPFPSKVHKTSHRRALGSLEHRLNTLSLQNHSSRPSSHHRIRHRSVDGRLMRRHRMNNLRCVRKRHVRVAFAHGGLGAKRVLGE